MLYHTTNEKESSTHSLSSMLLTVTRAYKSIQKPQGTLLSKLNRISGDVLAYNDGGRVTEVTRFSENFYDPKQYLDPFSSLQQQIREERGKEANAANFQKLFQVCPFTVLL